MGNYETADAVYEELGGVLRDALSNEAQLARLRKADAIFQFALTEPDAVLTFHARALLPAGVETGETKTVPDLVFAMEADAARALLLRERSPVLMLTSGEVAMKGSATKLLQVLGGLAPKEEAASNETPEEADETPEEAEETPAEPRTGEESTDVDSSSDES